jgi:hypothetical protein
MTPPHGPPIPSLTPIGLLAGEDEEDTRLLGDMSKTAESYLRSFAWCRDVFGGFFGGGVGGVLAIFLYNVRPTRASIGSWIWIVVGDVPPAYLPLKDANSPAAVFRTYLKGMSRWVALARQGRTATADDGVPPVDVPATPEWVDKLDHRLNSLRLIVQLFFDESDESQAVN